MAAITSADNAALKAIKALAPIILALIALLSSVFAYNRATDSHTDDRLGERITAVETQQKNDVKSIDEVKIDVREIRGDVKQILQWATGKQR